jgi:hypothetical protein
MRYRLSLKSIGVGATILAFSIPATATPVRIQMEDYSVGRFTIKERNSLEIVHEQTQEFGTTGPYNLDLAPGEYLLECYDVWDDSYRGGVYVGVPEASDTYTESNPYWWAMASVYCRVNNKNEDGTYFEKDKDYTIDFDIRNKKGETQEFIVSSWRENSRDYYAFPIYQATCTFTLTPTDLHPELITTTKSLDIVATSTTPENLEIAKAKTLDITTPASASFFLGKKIKHYMPFEELTPVKTVENGDNTTTYSYVMPNTLTNLYYRVSMPDVMTYTGLIVRDDNLSSINVSEAEMLEHGTPDYFNHSLTENGCMNIADIYLNINERNHLCLKKGDTKALVAQRIWQLTNNTVGNYFVEPDYHFSVYNDNFQPSNDVVTVDADGNLTAVGEGTAIVLVDYDACYTCKYNDGEKQEFEGGNKWSKLWAENTGVFVVSVGSGENVDSESFAPNFNIDKGSVNREDKTLDAEHDVLYYLEGDNGYVYNYVPTGAVKVEVANPSVDTEKNTVSYNGFSEVAPNSDGSYSLLLTYGRNIIRTIAADGSEAYQVISAKPMGYVVENNSREDSKVLPGDEVTVICHGLYHPTLKLAGVYNQSANLDFDQVGNDGPLYLGSGQYTFAGSEDAQTIKFAIDADYSEDTYTLTNGSIRVAGFGSLGGEHRWIDRSVGLDANLGAALTEQYWGVIPSISFAVSHNSGVDTLASENVVIAGVYSIAGVALNVNSINELPNGTYIIRYVDGQTKKVMLDGRY